MKNGNTKPLLRGLFKKYIGVFGIMLVLILVNLSTIINIDNDNNTGFDQLELSSANDFGSTIIQETIDLEFEPNLEEVNMNGEVWDFIRVENCVYDSIPGHPRIPIKILELNTPVKITSVDVRYSDPAYLSELRIVPVPLQQIWSNDGIITPEFYCDDVYYNTNEYLPSQDYELNQIGLKHDNNNEYYIYNLKIYPLKYNPQSSEVIFSKNVEVTYDYELPQPAIQDTRASQPEGSQARAPSDTYKYIIITTTDLTDELQPLVNWKTQKGLPAKMVTVSEITTNPLYDGVDDADEIRNFIQWAYEQWEIEYVLLAGDYNNVPTRHTYDAQAIYTGDDGVIPADTYYACIDEGTSWNDDGDTEFGEFGELDDIIPDVAVGRIAINSEFNMANWVTENLVYEKNPPVGDWFDTITLVSDYGFSVGDCADQSDFLYNTYFDNSYTSYSKLYDDSSGTDYISSAKIQEKINNGSALVVYTDHANINFWGSTISFTNAHAAGLSNNGKQPVVYVMACLSAGFDHTSLESIGEAFTENAGGGAIAYIGSSRVAVGAVGAGYTYEPTATGLEEDFARMLKDAQNNDQSQLRVGLIHKNALEYYATQWGDQFPGGSMMNFAQRSWLLLTLLGDPDSPIWTETPKNFKIINVTEKLVSDDVQVTIKVTDTVDLVTGIENALVAISKGTKAYDFGYTDSAGEAKFIITNPTIEDLDVTVTRPNFIPLEDNIQIEDFFPPMTSLVITPTTPDGCYGWYCSTPTIELTTEPLATTHYRWDSGTDNIYTTTLTVPEGNHTLFYYSIDLKNNVEEESSFNLWVDTVAPITFYNLTPELPNGDNGWFVTYPTINFTTDVNLSSESNATTYYRWDLNNDSAYLDEFQAFEGEHTLYYHSIDGAGNIETEKSLEFKIDMVAPRTNLTTTPSEPDGNDSWYKTFPALNLSLNRSDGAEEVETSFYYSWDNVTFTLFTELIAPPEGNHTLYYYAVDQAGNQEPNRTKVYKIDTVAPETIVDITPSAPDGENGWHRNPINITFSNYESALGFENCSTEIIYYHWDSEPDELYNSSTPLNLSEGIHTLYYHSIDISGNIEAEQFMEFKLDTIFPVTTLNVTPKYPENINGWYLGAPQIELLVEQKVVTYYNWDDQTAQIYNSSGELLRPEEGIHTLFYYSVDEAGNIELENTQEFKLDLERPEPVLTANFTKIYVEEDIIFSASQSSDFNGISEYYFNFGDGNTTGWISDAVVSHNYSEAGIYDVTLKVRDNSGSISTRRENVTLTINNKPKKSKDEGFLPDDLASFSMMIGLIILILAIILIAAASYTRKRRRYPRPRAAYAARTSSRRRPARYYYEDEIAVEPEIIWDEDEVYSDSERRYEEDYYYDEEYPEPKYEEEYWDEDYEPEEEYYEGYRDEEDVAWEEESEGEGEGDVDWDEEYDEPEEDYYDDRRTRRSERDEEYDDREYYDDYDEPSYSRQANRPESRPPPSPPARRKRKRLAPTWRKKQYKRRRPGLLDTEDANISEYDEDEADEF